MIPLASIDHVEVLEDGAAAQYGTDAIAGVVNIILKSSPDAGVASGTIGQYYISQGETYDLSINKGFAIGDHGFLNVTYDKKYQGFTELGGADKRVTQLDGQVQPGLPYDPTTFGGYPHLNHINGDPRYAMSTYEYNAGYDVAPNLHVYSFGTYGTRFAQGYENYRVPDKVVASPVLGVAGTYGAPGSIPFSVDGFNPLEQVDETDFQEALGIKGTLWGWNADLSTTYGRDDDKVYTINTANRSLFIDTHFTPTNLYDGEFLAGEWTSNLDINRDWDFGLASPTNIAFGFERREDTYQIEHGDPASIYKEGGQSFPGFLPTDAASHSRKNEAAYLDIAGYVIKSLYVDLAGRFEHYSDFGDAKIGKVTARYDITDEFAVRATASTGFRAPTLSEEYYSATNVAPSFAFVQLPPNSAAASLLGLSPLKPENSTNYSVGFVAHLADGFSGTIDAYSISLRDRVVGTGSLYGSGGAVNSPAVTAAILAHGNVLDPTVTYTGVNVFVNGISTMTKGVDITTSYASDFDDYGHVTWTAAANYTETSISYMAPTPAPIQPQGLFSRNALAFLTNGTPKERVTLGALWTLDKWTVNVVEKLYGPSYSEDSPNGGTYYKDEVNSAAITDLSVAYAVLDHLTITLGADNLFDKKPPIIGQSVATGPYDGGNVWNEPNGLSPYGVNGGFYYARATITF